MVKQQNGNVKGISLPQAIQNLFATGIVLCLCILFCLAAFFFAASAQAADLQQLIAEGKAKQYVRVTLMDPTLGIEAVRSVVPSGWKTQGQVFWNLQSSLVPAVFSFAAEAPDQSASAFYISAVGYEQPLSINIMGQLYQEAQLYQEGQYTENGNPMLRLMSPEEYGIYLLKKIFPNVTQIQVLKTDDLPPDQQAALDREALSLQEQFNQSSPPDAYTRDFAYRGGGVDLTFVQGGRALRGHIFVLTQSFIVGSKSSGYSYESLLWNVPGMFILFAEPEKFESMQNDLKIFICNLVINQQWNGALQHAVNLFNQQRIDAAKKRTEESLRYLQQQSQSFSQSIQERYESSLKTPDSNSRVMEGWTDAIVGRENYRAPDGGILKVDYHYDNVYSDNNGNIYATQGYELDPNQYTQLQKLPSVLPKE